MFYQCFCHNFLFLTQYERLFSFLNYLYFLYLCSKYIISPRSQNRIVLSHNDVDYLIRNYSQMYGILEYSMLHSRVNMHRSTNMDIIDKNYSIQNQSNDHCQSNNQQVEQIRYVEYQFGVGGLANKIFGLVSSYVIAALLNATFICNIESFVQCSTIQ